MDLSRRPPHGDSSDDENIPLQYLPQPPNYSERAGMVADSGSSQGPFIGKNTYPGEGNVNARQQQKPKDVRHRKRALLLLFLYLLLLVIPFPMTCVMIYRPLKMPSYINFRSEYKAADFDYNYRAQVAVRVLNSMRAICTVPLVGVILAQAAVIYTQKRAANSQNLSLAEIFRLADRGWTDPLHLWRAIHRRQLFVPLGALVLLLFVIAQPFEQLLVHSEELKVMTCYDNLACYDADSSPRLVGIEPWPNSVAHVPLFPVMQSVSNEITAAGMSTEPNPYLWTDNGDEGRIDGIQWNRTYPSTLEESSWFFKNDEPFQGQPFWTSSFPNGTTTGVLREHAMRLNSSVKCELIPPNEFPTPCPGDNPFVTGWSYSWDNDDNDEVSLSVCAPGDYTQTPWSHSRDRQDIREELYVNASLTSDDTPSEDPFALHCVAVTTRGYFELGNHFNGEVPQPLLDKWPTAEEMHEKFVDYDIYSGKNISTLTADDNETGPISFPTDYYNAPDEYTKNVDKVETETFPAPGPLLLTTIATFGNQSFIGALVNNPIRRAADINCANRKIPFVNFETFSYTDRCGDPWSESADAGAADALIEWLWNWNIVKDAQKYLSFSLFFANHATLAKASNYERGAYTRGYDMREPRRLYTSEGYTTQKPVASLGPIIFLAILYSLQLIVLISFAIYIWRNPAWTNGLGSFTISRIIANMDRDNLERLVRSQEGPGRSRRLSEVNGLIGVSWEDSNSRGGNPVRRFIPSGPDVDR